MTIKKRDTSKKRHQILDAATVAFDEKGYENATMDYIAEVSNSSKRTVYNHFPSKEALFQAMIERFIEELIEVKRISYTKDISIKEQLLSFINNKLQMANNPKWLSVMKISTAVFIANPNLAHQTMENISELECIFFNWLKAAVEDNKLKIDNIEAAATIFNSMVSGTFFWPTIIGTPLPEQMLDVMKHEIVDTFLEKYGA